MKIVCPRSGSVSLVHKDGVYLLPTTCKTWGCQVCEKSLLSYVKLRVLSGCLMFKSCVFTTLTLRVASGRIVKDADYVSMVFKRLLTSQRRKYGNLNWFKVVELTKKGQPHLHLVMSGWNGLRARCVPARRSRWAIEGWNEGCRDGGKCIMHEISKDWLVATGDSFVTETMPVYNAGGMGDYMGKYISKAFGDRRELERLGFMRRYSTSRGWPGKRSRLAGSVDETGWSEWKRVTREDRRHPAESYDKIGSVAALMRVEPLLNKKMRLSGARKRFKYLQESLNESENA